MIGNYEGAAVLPDCLESLAAQDRAPAEVIVVDAGSSDGSVSVAERFGATVLRAENRGLGYLYNLGARAARGEHVLLANNDLAFDRRCVGLLAQALDEDEQRFAADPRQLDWAGRRVIHARTVLARGPLLRQPLPGLRIDPVAPADRTIVTLCANGGAMLVRRQRLLELGGFDEAFFMDFEDLDLCWRAWLHGWSSVHVPQAVVRHRVGAVTGAKESPRRLASSHANLLRFAFKCLPAGPALRVLLGELLRLPAHPRPVAGALARTLLAAPAIGRARAALGPKAPLFDWLSAGQRGARP